jgi:hypothetical protein
VCANLLIAGDCTDTYAKHFNDVGYMTRPDIRGRRERRPRRIVGSETIAAGLKGSFS